MYQFLHLERDLGDKLAARLADDLRADRVFSTYSKEASPRGLDLEIRVKWMDFTISARAYALARIVEDAADSGSALRMPISMVSTPLRHRLLDLIVEIAETRALTSVVQDAHSQMRQQAPNATPPHAYRLLVTSSALAVWEPGRIDVNVMRKGRMRAGTELQTDPLWGVVVTPPTASCHGLRAGQRAAACAIAAIGDMYSGYA